jgi:hypothetical protein
MLFQEVAMVNMMKYRFTVPKSRGIPQSAAINPDTTAVITNDLFLHLLFGRIAASDNSTHELNTKYDPETDVLSLEIPDEFIDLIEKIKKDQKLQRFIDWLVSGLAASSISYDNSTSGLIAQNLQ